MSVIGRTISTNVEFTLLVPLTSMVGLDPSTPDVNGNDKVADVTPQQSWFLTVPSK